MKLPLFGFVLRRVRGGLRQLMWTHVLTAGTMAMTLFVFGGFMLVETNLQRLLKGWGEQIQVTAYLQNDLPEDAITGLLGKVRAMPEVERARLITQEQAWRDFQAALGTQSGLLDGLPREVLPASIEIALETAYRDGPALETLAERLRQESAIASVEYPQEWLERLGVVVLVVEWLKWILAGVLFLITFFIFGSTVKLAMLARRDEIEIMQLVGASEELIQAPFVIEGMIQGLTGASLAIVGLGAAYLFFKKEMAVMSGLLLPLGDLRFLDSAALVVLLATGLFLGALGSLISLRRFVRTWYPSGSRA